MMEYDYKIERDEGKEEPKIYRPGPIPQELDNLVEIEGPNSSGKSTLLNIIALAFYALDNDAVEDPLEDEIRNLYESSHQDLSFEVSINSEDVKLTSEKDLENKDITVRDEENGKILTPETFQEQYNLIYDIPDEPLNRIEKIAKNVEEIQHSYATDVKNLMNKVRHEIDDINNRKNPQRLETARKKLKESKKDKNRVETELTNLKQRFDWLRDFTYAKYYEKYKQQYENKKEELEELEEELADVEDTDGEEETSSQLEKLHSDLEKLRDKRNATLELMESVFSEEDSDISVWRDMDLEPSQETDFHFSDNLDEEIENLRQKIKDREEEIENKDAFEQADFYKKMSSLLEEYKNKGVKLPGDVSVDDFLNELRSEQEKYHQLLKEKNRCNEAKEGLDEFEKKVEEIRDNRLEDIREMAEQGLGPSVAESQRQKLETVKKTRDRKKEKFEFYKEKYEERDEPSLEEVKEEASSYINKWQNSTEEELKEKISEVESQIESKEDKTSKLESNIQKYSDLKEKLENTEPHKYEEYSEDLEELHSTLQNLDKKLRRKFDQFIKAVISGNFNEENASDLQLEYNNALFTYLGKRMGTIRHDDEDYDVSEVDLIDRTIYTKSGTEIKFDDMGTGQSQSAYLKSLLNTEDDRKIIALFDEVAMMDSKSLEPVYEKLKSLRNEGKLALGIVVQHADDEIEVHKIGG